MQYARYVPGLLTLSRTPLFRAAALICAVGMAANAQQPGNASPKDLVIRNIRVFDGTHVAAQSDVWIHEGHIKAVGHHLEAPAGVQSINGAGQTLLPGLIDAHTHAFGDALKQALIFGVTTELDMFTSYEYAAQIRKGQVEGKYMDLAD